MSLLKAIRHRAAAAAVKLPVILLIALALRVGFAWHYQHDKPEQALGAISFLYEPGNIAYSLATHKGFSSPLRSNTGPTAWMTPVYPSLLAGIFLVFGTYTYASFLAAIAFNIFCSSLTCVPLFHIGRRLGGVALGALAAWLWAIFPNALIIPSRDIWDDSLAALLASVILLATIRTGSSPHMRAWAAYGGLWGFTLMTNPTLGSVLPFLLGWLALKERSAGRPWVRKTALALGIATLICVPWTVRNYRVFHAWVPLRSVMGLQLWMGNNDESGKRWPGQLHPLGNAQERLQYTEMGEIRYMAEKRQEAFRFIASHPRREMELTARRFIATWSGGSETPVADFLHRMTWYFRFILLANVLAALGALGGIIILLLRRHPLTVPVVVFPIVFPLVSYVSLASPRYRHPIDPIILLLTAITAQETCKRTCRLP